MVGSVVDDLRWAAVVRLVDLTGHILFIVSLSEEEIKDVQAEIDMLETCHHVSSQPTWRRGWVGALR